MEQRCASRNAEWKLWILLHEYTVCQLKLGVLRICIVSGGRIATKAKQKLICNHFCCCCSYRKHRLLYRRQLLGLSLPRIVGIWKWYWRGCGLCEDGATQYKKCTYSRQWDEAKTLGCKTVSSLWFDHYRYIQLSKAKNVVDFISGSPLQSIIFKIIIYPCICGVSFRMSALYSSVIALSCDTSYKRNLAAVTFSYPHVWILTTVVALSQRDYSQIKP